MISYLPSQAYNSMKRKWYVISMASFYLKYFHSANLNYVLLSFMQKYLIKVYAEHIWRFTHSLRKMFVKHIIFQRKVTVTSPWFHNKGLS